MMAFGYDPYLSSWSPYHGAAYAVVDACAKVVAAGGDWSGMRFSYQEYFERMTADPHNLTAKIAEMGETPESGEGAERKSFQQ